MLALLLFAPASWAFETLGHATSSTFPAGGPASQGMGGGPGGGRGGFGGAQGGPPGMTQQGGGFGGPPGMTQQSGTTQGGGQAGGFAGGMGGPGGGGGGMFGGEDLTEALAYVNSHGGGTIAISSQSGASASIIGSGASVAGIGGFSGRESTVSIDWLADAVASGKVRWVISTESGGGMPSDGRAGSDSALTAAAQVGSETSVSGLYDLQGTAAALKALAS